MLGTTNGKRRRLIQKTRTSGPLPQIQSTAELAADWLASCKSRGLSPRTIHGYQYALERVLLPWLAERGEEGLPDQRVLDQLGVELLTRDNADPHKSGKLSRHTVVAYLRPIRHFLDWCDDQSLGSGARPHLPTPGRQIKKILSKAEITQMEDAAQTERDKLIILLLGVYGLRVGELVKLNTGDIRNNTLTVLGKGRGGGTPREIKLAMAARLARFAARGRPRDATSDALFVSLRRNGAGGYDRLSIEAVQTIVHWAAKGAGIERRVYPHLLRASAITYMLSRGMNQWQVSALVGNYNALEFYAFIQAQDAGDALLEILR